MHCDHCKTEMRDWESFRHETLPNGGAAHYHASCYEKIMYDRKPKIVATFKKGHTHYSV
jgi:hypothetical protein